MPTPRAPGWQVGYVDLVKEPIARLDDVLSATRRRLRLRGALRGGAAGAWVGAGAALLIPLLAWTLRTPIWTSLLAIGGTLAVAVAAGILLGRARARLSDRELALLADRALGTDEVFVTAQGLGETDPARKAVLDAVLRATSPRPDLRAALPARLPRHLRWAALPLGVGLALLLVPSRPPALGATGLADPGQRLRREGEELAGRLDAFAAQHPEMTLPDAARKLDQLADTLKEGQLTEAEARLRLEEIQDALDQLDLENRAAHQLLEEVEKAADPLAEAEATQSLSEAMQSGDPEDLSAAAEGLAEGLRDPSTARDAGEALKQAGEALAESDDPDAKAAGEALKEAGAQVEDGLSEDEARELAESLEKLQQSAEKARGQRDQAQQLRGEAQRTESALGLPEEGEGSGGATPGNQNASQPGTGHTWEDAGDHAGENQHQDADRNTDRTTGRTADDFKKLYKSVRRYDGAEGVLVEARSELAEGGRIDTLDVRFSAGEEAALAPLAGVPDAYQEEAARAIAGDEIPAGYREAVKSYFDDSRDR